MMMPSNLPTTLMMRCRELLMKCGGYLPEPVLRKTSNLLREIELRAWMAQSGLRLDPCVARREELFEMVGKEVGQLPVLYLEFGVAAGDATRYWAKLLKHPDSCLHGFDSFEGLPEAWSDCPKGMFSTGGALPRIDDSRVCFFKGWFDQTLPSYEPPSREVVILNMDADLYSSTGYVLRKLQSLIRVGTYVYFDEFVSLGHEERAFRELVEATGARFQVVGTTRDLMHVMFRCVGTAQGSSQPAN